MYKLRRLPFLLAFTLIVVFALSSCISNGPRTGVPGVNGNDGKEKTVLKFISSWGGVDSKAKTLKKVLDKFEKDNPDVDVVNESLFGEDFLPKIKTDFASGNTPDVFGLWPGSDIRALIQIGKVADLTDILNADNKWKQDFGQDMWAYTTYDGKVYGLPVEVIFECMFINRDLFEKYGVKIPQTFEELKEAVEAFKQNNIIPISYNSFAEGTYLYQNIIAMLGGRTDTEAPFENGKVKGCYIDAMKYVKELYDMKAFPPDSFTMTNNARNALFRDKKAAMIVQGSWFIGDFSPDDTTVDIIPLPSIPGGKSPQNTLLYGLGCGSFHMSTAAEGDPMKQKASIKLLKALTSEETAAAFASETGMISNINMKNYQVDYRRLTKKGSQMLSDAELLVGPPDSFVYRSAWEEIIVQQFPYYLEGTISAEEVWAKAISGGIIPK